MMVFGWYFNWQICWKFQLGVHAVNKYIFSVDSNNELINCDITILRYSSINSMNHTKLIHTKNRNFKGRIMLDLE